LKIDVEGNEMDVLEGAKETIAKFKPLIAIEVIDNHLKRGGSSRKAIFDFIYGMGYYGAVNKYGMKETVDKPTGAADIFFLPDKGWYAPKLYIGYKKLLEKNGRLGSNPEKESQGKA